MKRTVLSFLLAAALGARASDFEVTTATYLGGPSVAEEWNAIDVAPDGAIVVAGRLPDTNPGGARSAWLMAGGDGIVLRIAPDGKKVLTNARIGDSVHDMEIDGAGRIAICGSFGVAVLSTNGTRLLWHDGDVIRGTKAAAFRNQTPPFKLDRYRRRVSRVAAGGDGTVASLQAEEKAWGSDPKKGRLYVWDKDGKRLCDVQLTRYKYPEDLVVASEQRLVIVGGFNTYKADSPHMKGHPIHMQFLTAYSYDGNVKWAVYDFPAADVYAQNHYADSRVQRLTIGADGLLYMGGYIHGGDYIWKLDPHDEKKRAPNSGTGYDGWSRAHNMGRGIDHGYFAKFDPATGDFLRGQSFMCRRESNGGGKPSQLQVRGIDADKEGNVYLSGYCEKYIKNRDACSINGKTVAAYHKPEAFLMVVSPDFKKRHVWTVFSGAESESASWGVAVGENTAALIGEVYEGEMVTTDSALQPGSARPFDGYLVVWEPLLQSF